MEYTFQDGDAIQPVSFLNELRSQMGMSKLTIYIYIYRNEKSFCSDSEIYCVSAFHCRTDHYNSVFR